MKRQKRIALVGMPLSGKSAVLEYLVKEMPAYRLVDLDAEVERVAKASIPFIFQTKGENYFRQLECKALEGCLLMAEVLVVAGGGVVTTKEARTVLSEYDDVLYLKTALPTLVCRLQEEEIQKRPLFKQSAKMGESVEAVLERLLVEREPYFIEVATHTICTDGKDVEEVAEEVKRFIENS